MTASVVPLTIADSAAWFADMDRMCVCDHRLLTHNSEEHPRAPLACRACPCPKFEEKKP